MRFSSPFLLHIIMFNETIYSLHNYGKLLKTLFAVVLWSAELIQYQAVQNFMTWGEMGVWKKTLFI